MKRNYEDIINLPHHVSAKYPQMSMENRAAQFSPFAALNGHESMISETGRLTERKIELAEDAKAELDFKQNVLAEIAGERPEVAVTYFEPDARKSGGKYVTVSGLLRKLDEHERTLVLTDGTKISLDDILDIDSGCFENVAWAE